LHIAAGMGNVALATWLLDHKADVNARTTDRKRLPAPGDQIKNVEVAKLLIDRGAEVDSRDARGYTPLMRSPCGPMTALLITAGANVKAQGDDGYTPLHFVGDPESAQLLMDKGRTSTPRPPTVRHLSTWPVRHPEVRGNRSSPRPDRGQIDAWATSDLWKQSFTSAFMKSIV